MKIKELKENLFRNKDDFERTFFNPSENISCDYVAKNTAVLKTHKKKAHINETTKSKTKDNALISKIKTKNSDEKTNAKNTKSEVLKADKGARGRQTI